jgi:hypothetical protein
MVSEEVEEIIKPIGLRRAVSVGQEAIKETYLEAKFKRVKGITDVNTTTGKKGQDAIDLKNLPSFDLENVYYDLSLVITEQFGNKSTEKRTNFNRKLNIKTLKADIHDILVKKKLGC